MIDLFNRLLEGVANGLIVAAGARWAWERRPRWLRGPVCEFCGSPPSPRCLNGPCPQLRPAEWAKEQEWRRELDQLGRQ